MKITMSSASGVPADFYRAEFAGVESTPPNTEKGYPPGLKWSFRVAEGTYAGSLATRVTGDRPTAKNACGKMLAALVGPVADGTEVDLDAFVGRPYMIVVGAGEGGGTRVETVRPA